VRSARPSIVRSGAAVRGGNGRFGAGSNPTIRQDTAPELPPLSESP